MSSRDSRSSRKSSTSSSRKISVSSNRKNSTSSSRKSSSSSSRRSSSSRTSVTKACPEPEGVCARVVRGDAFVAWALEHAGRIFDTLEQTTTEDFVNKLVKPLTANGRKVAKSSAVDDQDDKRRDSRGKRESSRSSKRKSSNARKLSVGTDVSKPYADVVLCVATLYFEVYLDWLPDVVASGLAFCSALENESRHMFSIN
jgi:hypothetical protein